MTQQFFDWNKILNVKNCSTKKYTVQVILWVCVMHHRPCIYMGLSKPLKFYFINQKTKFWTPYGRYFLFCESTENVHKSRGNGVEWIFRIFPKGKGGSWAPSSFTQCIYFWFDLFYHFAFDFIYYKWIAYITHNIAAFLFNYRHFGRRSDLLREQFDIHYINKLKPAFNQASIYDRLSNYRTEKIWTIGLPCMVNCILFLIMIHAFIQMWIIN